LKQKEKTRYFILSQSTPQQLWNDPSTGKPHHWHSRQRWLSFPSTLRMQSRGTNYRVEHWIKS
jgi:hypothetical protein